MTLTPDDGSVAVMLCPLRPCAWQSPDTRTMTPEQAEQVRADHLLTAHPDELRALASIAGALPAPLPSASPPRWSATDGNTRAHLLDQRRSPGLLLLIEQEQAALSVRLPDEALRRGARAVGEYLIERAGAGPVRLAHMRADLAELAAQLDRADRPGALCGLPHPTRRGRSCTEPAGHAGADDRGASHGDGRTDRWVAR